MKKQTAFLGTIVVRYESGGTWFDGSLQVVPGSGDQGHRVCIGGTDAIVALRDFLNSLDLSGRKLALIKGERGS
jgi:hypothetical protein